MRGALGAVCLGLLLAGCVAEPAPSSHPTSLEVSKARGPMPGAVEIRPEDFSSSPGVLKLKALLDEARSSDGHLFSVVVSEEEMRAVQGFLEDRWREARGGPPPSPPLVRYQGSDFSVRFASG